MFAVGDVVGSYTILAHLRSGGMADLFLAYREGAAGFRRMVAIKVIHARHSEDERLVRMFLDEALISARIDHPNVVHVEDLGELHETYFLVMEYVHGCSLAQLMKELGEKRRRLSPTVAVAIVARIAEGLHAAHETTDDEGRLVSLVHRDVSPQNILLSHKGHVKLIDFGVAKADLRSEQTNVAMLKGKVRYMAPEQATTGRVDRRSDVYSLAIVLWEMLTMRRLFAGKSEFEILLRVRDPKVRPPSELVDEIPRELDAVILSALSKDPAERPQTAKELRRMLARAEPRSMALDSAHLADLVSTTMGDQLERHRTELPQEISRLLEAEQLRAALAMERDERDTHSAMEVLTLHSDMVVFEEEDLDEPSAILEPHDPTDDPLADTQADTEADTMGPGVELKTRPGRPGRMPTGEGAAISSGEAAAMDVPTMEEADPTWMSERPAGLPTQLPRFTPMDEDSKQLATRPYARPSQAPPAAVPNVGQPPRLGRRRAVTPVLILGLAIAIAAAVGTIVALLWPFGAQGQATPLDRGLPSGAATAVPRSGR